MAAKEMFKKLNCEYAEDEDYIDIEKRYSIHYQVLINKNRGEMYITFTDTKQGKSIVTLLHEEELKAFGALAKEQGWLNE